MKKQNGFTLIEILIAMTLIAILSVLAIPKLTQYLDDAKVSVVAQAAVTAKRVNEYKLATGGSYADCTELANFSGIDSSITVGGTLPNCTFTKDGKSASMN